MWPCVMYYRTYWSNRLDIVFWHKSEEDYIIEVDKDELYFLGKQY